MAKLILTPEHVAQLLVDAGFVGWQVVRMGQIAMAESALNAYAVNVVDNPTSPAHLSMDLGLLQINSYWSAQYFTSLSSLFYPDANAVVAHRIFVARGGLTNPILGYNAWTTYRNGSYLKWQPQAIAAARSVGAY